jgi:hypothetical protein
VHQAVIITVIEPVHLFFFFFFLLLVLLLLLLLLIIIIIIIIINNNNNNNNKITTHLEMPSECGGQEHAKPVAGPGARADDLRHAKQEQDKVILKNDALKFSRAMAAGKAGTECSSLVSGLFCQTPFPPRHSDID